MLLIVPRGVLFFPFNQATAPVHSTQGHHHTRKEASIRKTFAERNSRDGKGKPTPFRKIKERAMKRMLILFPLVLALIIASTTCVLAAGPPIQTLKGEFATIGMTSCVQADAGGDFGPDLGPKFQLSTHGSTRVWQSAGVLSLFGDGNGSWIGKYVLINNGAVEANSYPVSGFTTDCDVAYQAMEDGTIRFDFDCIATFTAGYYGSDTQAGNSHFTAEYARLSADGVTLVIWDLDPRVENIWITTGTTTTYHKQVCSRTGTAIRFR